MDKTIHRNRQHTTQRIVEALEQVIDEWGLQGIGVNRVAEKAGVSKVLIYRYFGGIEGLLEYYVKKGKLFPIFTPEVLDRIRPLQKSDLAPVWYREVTQLYRLFRTSKASREILKAVFIENDSVAEVTSQAIDGEMIRLVSQIAFVKGADSQAISAVILGGMSYLTIMAHNDRSVIGLDLRSEGDWKRIEDAVKLIYIALNKLAIGTDDITLTGHTAQPSAGRWP